jgi:hypothetical protein
MEEAFQERMAYYYDGDCGYDGCDCYLGLMHFCSKTHLNHCYDFEMFGNHSRIHHIVAYPFHLGTFDISAFPVAVSVIFVQILEVDLLLHWDHPDWN